MIKVSIVVPTTSIDRLRTLLLSLRNQSFKPWEIIIVAKNVNINFIEKICNNFALKCITLEQKEGYVTKALNMGKNASSGDIIIFTDDDAIALNGWIKRYVKFFNYYGKDVVCASSRDIYINLSNIRLLPTSDDMPIVKLYRIFLRPILERPISILDKYWCGTYIDKRLYIRFGPCIPNKECYSLPFRGVNMAFRGDVVDEFEFPEHPLLKRGIGYEQYIGLQLVLKGWDCVYTPNNPILHMYRGESLSRTRSVKEIDYEYEIMRSLLRQLLSQRSY